MTTRELKVVGGRKRNACNYFMQNLSVIFTCFSKFSLKNSLNYRFSRTSEFCRHGIGTVVFELQGPRCRGHQERKIWRWSTMVSFCCKNFIIFHCNIFVFYSWSLRCNQFPLLQAPTIRRIFSRGPALWTHNTPRRPRGPTDIRTILRKSWGSNGFRRTIWSTITVEIHL